MSSTEIYRAYSYFSLLLLPLWSIRLIYQFLDHFTDNRTPWMGDQLIARPLPKHRTTQTQNKRIHTPNIHDLCGIQTYYLGFQASEDSACLGPLGYHDQLFILPFVKKKNNFFASPFVQLKPCFVIQPGSYPFHTSTWQQL
jgi:hypothetical protein